MRRSLGVALVVAWVVAGCSLPGDSRTFEAGNVTVVDESGLVTGATAGAPDPGTDDRPLVVSPGNLTRIAVHWSGPDCVAAWRVSVPAGNALRIVIEPVEPPEDPCAGTAEDEDLSVTLDLNRVVQADAIEVDQLPAS